jgi:hypothetical protein
MERDHDTQRQLRRIEQRVLDNSRKLDALIRAAGLILQEERLDAMAIKDTITKLQGDVRDNKNAADAVKTALEGYAKVNADLTQQLKDAIANDADAAALEEIATQLEANNAELHAAAPATAAAVVANTPAE